jgi:hypothetical protein
VREVSRDFDDKVLRQIADETRSSATAYPRSRIIQDAVGLSGAAELGRSLDAFLQRPDDVEAMSQVLKQLDVVWRVAECERDTKRKLRTVAYGIVRRLCKLYDQTFQAAVADPVTEFSTVMAEIIRGVQTRRTRGRI